jgi:xylose isomerase
MAAYEPVASDKFAFGIWCVTNIGRDPFGDASRKAVSAVRAVRGLAERGCWGFEFHDNDVVPISATAAQTRKTLSEVKRVMRDTGIRCASGTTNLFYHPVFKDGAFTSNDPKVRAYAIQKAIHAVDMAAELKAQNFIFWGGREGVEVDLAKDPVEATKRLREAINFICYYSLRNRYRMTFTIEPKPNEPRGDAFLPTVGNALAFIETLDPPIRKKMGVNPEVAHIKMAGLNPYHEYAQALEAGKLFELHLNDQKPLRYDQDLAFASVDLKEAFFIVKLMVDNKFKGTKAFDAHAYRNEDQAGVWLFVERNMRIYKMLEQRVAEVNADPQVRQLLADINAQDPKLDGLCAKYSPGAAKRLRALRLDPDKLARGRTLPYEQLDHRLNELLLGLA